jgi:hypothetical protein
MSLDLSPLLARAFHTSEAPRATIAIAEARDLQPEGSRSYEVIVPAGADRAWLETALVKKLVYYCESTRAPLPACGGVFVTLFVGEHLYCVLASDVIAFACDALGTTSESLVQRFGTGEVRHALTGPVR